MKLRVLIADKLSEAGIDWLKEQADIEVDVTPGLPPDELAKIVGDYDGMIIRSGVKVTADVLANPGRLKCIARAGVGVDNIDVPVATAKGIIVMNTPGGNTLSTAELALALMLDMSRKIAPANVSLRKGEWNRKAYQGTQLAGKTLGVVGMGRIGMAVARRAAAMEMHVLGYDPFFAGSGGEDAFKMVKDLNELCAQADYITVHTPKSKETMGLVGREQFAVMKPTTRVINAARGGIIDEQELLKALDENRIAGAALDVYMSEPPTSEVEKRLIAHPKMLAVPHLGASTAEAQEQVAMEAARQLVEALSGQEVRNALNAPGFDRALPPLVRGYCDLATRMGTVLAKITPGALARVEVAYRGAVSEMNIAPITAYLLVGLLSPHMDQPINVINAPVLAEQRGVEVEQVTFDKVKEFSHVIEVRIATDQMKRSAVATMLGDRLPRIIAIDGYRMEMKPEGHILFIFNDDVPGVVGTFGTILGKNNVNIADMMLSRKIEPKKAVMGISLDGPPGGKVIEEIRGYKFVNDVYYLELPELPVGERGDDAIVS